MINFLKIENKIVISIGGANFMREFNFKNNQILYKKDKLLDNKKHNLNTFDGALNNNCAYVDDKNILLGEITEPLIDVNIEYFFPKIKCDNDKIISLFKHSNF